MGVIVGDVRSELVELLFEGDVLLCDCLVLFLERIMFVLECEVLLKIVSDLFLIVPDG